MSAARGLRRTLLGLGALAGGLLALTYFGTDHLRAFGGAPSAATLARMRASPRFARDHFENAEPTGVMKATDSGSTLRAWLFGPELRVPNCPLPLYSGAAKVLSAPSTSGLRITWLGHSTTLVELDGARILIDPIWSERASPSQWIGPRRFHPPPLALDELPRLDAVVVSHEHYDHLDMDTVRALAGRGVPFHVPLGLGAHLAVWGVPAAQIIEHDWWEAQQVAPGVRVVSTPARHFAGRGVPWRVGALWSSWALTGPVHRVFFSGDTGLTDAFREVARREGPFDAALLEIGQYHPNWGDIHLGPLGALEAFLRLGARRFVPVHWSTFELGLHGWSEPAETLVAAAQQRGVAVRTPRLGEPLELGGAPEDDGPTFAWWRPYPPLVAACP